MSGIAITSDVEWRFHMGVNRSEGPEACWPWKGATSGFGYGRMKIRGRLISPHRIAYAIKHCRLEPDGSYHGGMVMHRCDNPICCNPAHLTLGTAAENAQDMTRKGRANRLKGAAVKVAKLTEEDVRAILASPLSSRETAAQFGLSDSYVRTLRRRQTWAHLKIDELQPKRWNGGWSATLPRPCLCLGG